VWQNSIFFTTSAVDALSEEVDQLRETLGGMARKRVFSLYSANG